MYNIEKISLNNKTFMFDSWNNTLGLIFEINENKGWNTNFEVKIDENGNIERCSSCVSMMDNIDYYIQIGETLRIVKEFIGKYGKEIFKKLNEIKEKITQTKNGIDYDYSDLQVSRIIDVKLLNENEIKENRGYHALADEMNELFNEIYALRKTRRRLRREDKIAEITKEIEEKELRYNHVENMVTDIQNEIDKYSNDYDKVFKELRESNSNLIDNILDNYMLKLGELIEG